MRTLGAIVVLLAVFGASTQCVTDCFAQPSVPPCHQQSQGKSSTPDSCRHVQPAADTQAALCPPAVETPMLADTSTPYVLGTEIAPPGAIRASLDVLRL